MALFKQQYYKKAVEFLKKMGFVGINIDPLCYAKKSEKFVVYAALYVNYNLMVVQSEEIE